MDNLIAGLSTEFPPVFFNLLSSLFSKAVEQINPNNWPAFSASAIASFTLIAVAEIGDKSQLVCMTLASKHRAMPVLLGAIAAFALLNTLAVIFGLAIANCLPEYWVSAIVACLFAAFGIHALVADTDTETDEISAKSHAIFFSTFLLITVAEFGDKTQLAVVALSSTSTPLAVWLGSTLALSSTSLLGVVAGRTFLKNIPLNLLHKLSGGLFLLLAALAAYQSYTAYSVNIA